MPKLFYRVASGHISETPLQSCAGCGDWLPVTSYAKDSNGQRASRCVFCTTVGRARDELRRRRFRARMLRVP